MHCSRSDAFPTRRPPGSLQRVATHVATLVERIEEVLLASAVLLIAAMTIANVFCRSLLGFSLAVTDEVAQVSIIVLCFTGLSYAAGKGRHIRMTALYDMLPESARKVMMIVITSVTSVLLFVLCWYAAAYVLTVHRLGGISPALRIPYWSVYLVAPVGLFLAGVQYALAAVKNMTTPGVYLSFTRADTYESDDDQPAECQPTDCEPDREPAE
jgi:C4-dicarboxylate transporter DctQ subunit